MANVKFRASRRTLSSHAGLSIIGQCFEIAGVDSIDSRFRTPLGMLYLVDQSAALKSWFQAVTQLAFLLNCKKL